MVNFYNALVAYLKQYGIWILDGSFYLLKFLIYTLVDGILSMITVFFQSLNMANALGSYVADWSGLPSQMGYVIGQTGLPSCIALLLAAVGIRMLINLIPSWATRV